MLACVSYFSTATHIPGLKLYSINSGLFITRYLQWLLILVLLAVGAACGSAPVQEMSEARQAIEAARAAGAEKHAGGQLGKARELLKSAEGMLNDRRYRDARRDAIKARDEAISARETAQTAEDR